MLGRLAVSLLILATTACQGQIGDRPTPGAGTATGSGTGSAPAAPTPLSFTCDSAAPQPSFSSDMRRLSKTQLRYAVSDLVAELLGESARAAVDDALVPNFALVPDDITTTHAAYARMDQTVSQSHIAGYYRVAINVADELTRSPARVARAVGTCATDGDRRNDDACVDRFITRFGRLAFRRPLTRAESSFFRGQVYRASGYRVAAVRDVITAMLSAPDFLYVIERGQPTPVDAKHHIYRLTAHELAARLSLHFWQSVPDAALLAAADDGSLLTDAGYKAQVKRMLADKRSERATEAFYSQWLDLARVPDMAKNVGRADFAAYVGDDRPTPALRHDILADVHAMLRYYTHQHPGTLSDLLLSRRSFATSADVAKLYGAPVWDGVSEPPKLADSRRVGLLTRLFFLVNDQAITRPILRGAFVVRRLLCQDIQLPNMMNNVRLEPAKGQRSTRQRVEDLTQAKGSVCAGCHDMINPVGFVFEGFDALGRTRTVDRIFDPTTGKLAAEVPVDTSATLSLPGLSAGAISRPEQLEHALLDSGRVQACMARHYFRFTFARREDPTRDGCVLERLRRSLADAGGTLRGMLEAIAYDDAFKLVRKAP